MKNYFLLVFISVAVYNLADAQFTIENYPIDQFKLPDIDRQAMEFTGNFIGDFNTRSNTHQELNYTTSELQPQVGLFYSRYVNREDMQAIYSASSYPDFRMVNTNNDFSDEKTNTTRFRPDLIFSGTRLKYRGNRFTSLGTLGNIFYDQYFEKQEESGLTDKTHSQNLDLYLELPVGFGTGRLEQVSDMAMALFLLNDAMEAGIDGALISPAQVDSFAAKMVTLRNERVFDTRIKRKYELRELFAFMKENNWTIADDPGFFTVLTDNWLYNMNVNRLAGKRWTYEFIPSYRYSNYKQRVNDEDPSKSTNHTLSGGIQATFEKHKPIDVHHDIIRAHSLGVGYSSEMHDAGPGDLNNQELDVRFTSSFGRQWTPNSRTVVTATLLMGYTYAHPVEQNVILPEDDHIANLTLNGTANYFISYRTRLFGSFSMSCDYHKNGDYILVNYPFQIEELNTGFHVRLNTGITVSIF